MRNIQEKYQTYFIYAVLTAVTLAVFWQVRTFDFVTYDDGKYVSENTHILTGLSWDNIAWVFTNEHVGNWHPLTGLSHILDCELFGPKPGRHHLVSLLFHIANTLLLFSVLRRMTATLWQSALVAALFAVHPLHVESVAWISERKDVLSTFFWLLTIAAYVRYVKNPNVIRYVLAIVLFALGLMAKPMLVTLPFTLLLLDYWPLNRLENISVVQVSSRQTIFRLILEKTPFFILSAGASFITFFVQRSGGAVVALAKFPLRFRLANAVLSYVKYIGKMVWPIDLAVFYPFRNDALASVWVLVALAFLLVVSIRVIQLAPTHRYLPVGWFWFLGTLVPVIGIVQVGGQALADRYTYVPLIGLFIIAVWGLDELFAKVRSRKIILTILAFAVLAALAICTRLQVSVWQNSRSLWEHALLVSRNEASVLDKFATALATEGRFAEAAEYYRMALKTHQNPDPDMVYNMGCAYNSIGRYQEAIDAYMQAIKLDPNRVDSYVGLGNTLGKIGRHAESEQACKLAIKIKPDSAEAYATLGAAYFSQGYWTQAVEASRRAISLDPDYAQAYYGLGMALLRLGDRNAALAQFEILKKLDTDLANTLLSNIQK